MKKSELKAIIDEILHPADYGLWILKHVKISNNKILFWLPPANTDWVIDTFKVIEFLYKNHNWLVDGENTPATYIKMIKP